MDYSFKTDVDIYDGYVIKRTSWVCSDKPWIIVGRISSKKILSFFNFITDENEQKEIKNFAHSVNLI